MLGPFYEYVNEDKLMEGNPHLVKTAQASQATLKVNRSTDSTILYIYICHTVLKQDPIAANNGQVTTKSNVLRRKSF